MSNCFDQFLVLVGSHLGAAAESLIWASVPTHVRLLDLPLDTFCWKLKTYFTV